MALKIEKATRKSLALKMAIYGNSGSGKTYSSLNLLSILSNGKPIGLIDTENRASEKYAKDDSTDSLFDFYIVSLGDPDRPDDVSAYTPEKYIEALELFREEGIEFVIIDSLTHAYMWSLDEVNKQSVKFKGNSFVAWKDVTPRYNALMRYIMGSNANIICTLRAKTSYEMVENDKGRSSPKAIGLEPIIRAGFEYEFDIVVQMDDTNAIITKTRCFELEGKVFNKPGKDLAKVISKWLGSGISEEDAKRATYIQRIIEYRQQLIENGETLEDIDLNSKSTDELIAIGKSLKLKLDIANKENK